MPVRPENLEAFRKKMTGRKHSEETKRKISKSRKGKIFGPRKELHELKDVCHRHNRIRKKYGKTYCEKCGIHLLMHLHIYGKQFDIHCNSFPKNYNLDIPENWKTFCCTCHIAHEASIDNFQPNVFFYDY